MFKILESRNNCKLRMTSIFVFKEITRGLAMFYKIIGSVKKYFKFYILTKVDHFYF